MQTTDKTPEEPDYLMIILVFLAVVLTAATMAALIVEYLGNTPHP